MQVFIEEYGVKLFVIGVIVFLIVMQTPLRAAIDRFLNS